MLDDPFERRRAERRYAMNFLDYEIVSPEGETLGRGLARTLNVSETGLLLETGQFFEPGQLLRITMGLENDLVQLTGRVAHSRPRDDDLCTTGVHFVEFDQAKPADFPPLFRDLAQGDSRLTSTHRPVCSREPAPDRRGLSGLLWASRAQRRMSMNAFCLRVCVHSLIRPSVF